MNSIFDVPWFSCLGRLTRYINAILSHHCCMTVNLLVPLEPITFQCTKGLGKHLVSISSSGISPVSNPKKKRYSFVLFVLPAIQNRPAYFYQDHTLPSQNVELPGVIVAPSIRTPYPPRSRWSAAAPWTAIRRLSGLQHAGPCPHSPAPMPHQASSLSPI